MPATPTTSCSSTCILITIALVVALAAVVYYMMHPDTDAAAAAEAEHFYAAAAEAAKRKSCASKGSNPADFLPPPPKLPEMTNNVDEPAGAAGDTDGPATDGPAPLSYTMGTLDGIRLKTGCPGNWRHPPCGARFASSTQNQAVQGHQLPLVTPATKNEFPTAPSVDGNAGSPQSMFMLAYNQSDPACCPSTYSSDRGCVCTTPAQREWIARGGRWKGGKMGECE